MESKINYKFAELIDQLVTKGEPVDVYELARRFEANFPSMNREELVNLIARQAMAVGASIVWNDTAGNDWWAGANQTRDLH